MITNEENLALFIEAQFDREKVHLSAGVKRLYYAGFDIEHFSRRAARAVLAVLSELSKAQVEAAAQAMMADMFAAHELPLDDELTAKYRGTALQALRAARSVALTRCQSQEPSPIR